MAQLDILDELDRIERKSEGYTVITVLSNIALQLIGIYGSIYLSTYIWRLIACPC